MNSSSLPKLGPPPPDALHALLITLIRRHGGAVTVNATALIEASETAWTLTPRPGPGPGESTWTLEEGSRAPMAATMTEPNDLLREARERIGSPHHPSQPMSRSELAEAVRILIREGTGHTSAWTGHYIAKLERGIVRWPQPAYRDALRTVLQVDTDADLGFYERGHKDTLIDSVGNGWAEARKINAHGQEVVLDENHPLAAAPATRARLARAKQTLPDGFCGLPIQSSCEHTNSCLTCPVFITTPAFLPQHEARLRTTLKLVDRFEAAGHARIAEKNRQIADNLARIIRTCKNPGP